MAIIESVALVSSWVAEIIALAILLIKPLRERVVGIKDIREGQKCLLRASMLHTYYKGRETQTIRQYEYENFLMEYGAYKALKGNSFMDKIFKEISDWEVVS